MTIPGFLDVPYRYLERAGVTDVQTIVDDFESEVLSPADEAHPTWVSWTSPSGGLYKCPVDAYGRFFDVLLTRVTQQKLEIRLRDQAGVAVYTRRMQGVSTNGWTVRMMTNLYGCHVDLQNHSISNPVGEFFNGGMLDMAPDLPNAHIHYVFGNGSRTVLDVLGGYTAGSYFMVDAETSASVVRAGAWQGTGSATACGHKMISGAKVFRPVELYAKASGAGGLGDFYHYAGKVNQMLLGPNNTALGARVYVPLDIGILGQFVCCSGPTAHNSWLLFMRCA